MKALMKELRFSFHTAITPGYYRYTYYRYIGTLYKKKSKPTPNPLEYTSF